MVTTTATFGRYLLGPRIAQGGMGEVFLATQTGMGAFAKPLVLKLMLPHLSQSTRAIEMFLAEARHASRMNHPNVVQIFDVGLIDGRYFIAMELVRGVSLARLANQLANANEALPMPLLVYIARCLCDGLHHAHEQRDPSGRPLNLVHQDVTLENVLVGADGQVKLTDFGIARAEAVGSDGQVVGKRGYIPPERFLGAPIDRRADVYAAAVTLLSLAALEPPHRRAGRSVPETMVTPLPDDLTSTLLRAAAPEPAARFQTARALRDALPPPTTADAAEQLGELVRRLCATQVTQLDGDVARTSQVSQTQRPPTEAVSLLTPVVDPKPAARPPTPVRMKVAGGVAVALLGAGAVFALTRPAPPGDAPPPLTATPSTALEQAPAGGAQATRLDAALAGPPGVNAPAARGTDESPLVEAPARLEPPRPTVNSPVGPAPPPPRAPSRLQRSRQKPAPVAEGHGTGVLTLDATPWAEVSIGGQVIGDTPIAAYAVRAGTVTIEFFNPETQVRKRRTVSITPGARLTVNEDVR
ncbi:MAG: protein kinase [Myxococcaceae bacterium]|nr:protein kinase [Myxococcaceae bacterium]